MRTNPLGRPSWLVQWQSGGRRTKGFRRSNSSWSRMVLGWHHQVLDTEAIVTLDYSCLLITIGRKWMRSWKTPLTVPSLCEMQAVEEGNTLSLCVKAEATSLSRFAMRMENMVSPPHIRWPYCFDLILYCFLTPVCFCTGAGHILPECFIEGVQQDPRHQAPLPCVQVCLLILYQWNYCVLTILAGTTSRMWMWLGGSLMLRRLSWSWKRSTETIWRSQSATMNITSSTRMQRRIFWQSGRWASIDINRAIFNILTCPVSGPGCLPWSCHNVWWTHRVAQVRPGFGFSPREAIAEGQLWDHPQEAENAPWEAGGAGKGPAQSERLQSQPGRGDELAEAGDHPVVQAEGAAPGLAVVTREQVQKCKTFSRLGRWKGSVN